tara:strand:- start:31 stop:372 length:342 start_codon:yes stop_codon:yes gene_type:complete
MAKKMKCHKCGTEDSIHIDDEATSKIIADKGPRDSTDGLDTYIIYCRSCGCMNIYKPGWIGNFKFHYFVDLAPKAPDPLLEGRIHTYASVRLQQFMQKDGFLPKDWSFHIRGS